MASPDAEALCQACGLCCDGSLFGRVTLEPHEVPQARRLRLHVIPSGRSFEQPCAALARAPGGELACAVYDERPAGCRRFVCRLLDRFLRDGGPIAPHLASVRRARRLLCELDSQASRDELARLLEEDFSRA